MKLGPPPVVHTQNCEIKYEKALFRDHHIVYVYHNRIDAIGDKLQTEDKLPEAAEDAIEDLTKLVRKLTSANFSNILITADHGFLYVERNYNLIELGPKGTGKSHIFSEFSPHGILISGGEVTVPKLFVSNASGKIGLVGYWDTIAFDEFAGRQKKVDKALVDIMKNYLANKSFSRGVETLGAEASMAFIGNTKHSVAYMLKHTDLFEELPEKYYDSAFIDRLHAYLPGWEIDVIRGEMFATGYGFIVDYLAEVLRFVVASGFDIVVCGRGCCLEKGG